MFPCPHCGEPVPDGARSCPHCGSDDETGWNPDAEYLSVDLPDDQAPQRRTGVSNAFAVFVLVVGLMGIIALAETRALGSPLALIAAAGVVAGILAYIRRRPR